MEGYYLPVPRVLSVNGAYVEAPSPPEPVPEPPRVLSVPVPPPLSGIVVLKPSGLVVAGKSAPEAEGKGVALPGGPAPSMGAWGA